MVPGGCSGPHQLLALPVLLPHRGPRSAVGRGRGLDADSEVRLLAKGMRGGWGEGPWWEPDSCCSPSLLTAPTPSTQVTMAMDTARQPLEPPARRIHLLLSRQKRTAC